MWTVELLDEAVVAELSRLPADIQARFQRVVLLIQQHGLDRVREPHVKHVAGAIREMRLSGPTASRAHCTSLPTGGVWLSCEYS